MHFMDDPSERLREARKKAGYKTMREAAEAHGWDYPTYAGHENGHRGFSHLASSYALAYRVNLNWLIGGRGPMKGRGDTDPILEMFRSLPPDKQAQALDYLAYLASRKE